MSVGLPTPDSGLSRTVEMTKSLLMKVRLYNNRLIKAREELGLTQCAAAEAIGVQYGSLNALENLRVKAWKRNASGDEGWTQTALKIASFYGFSPEYLWPEEIALVRKNAMRLELAAKDIHVLIGGELDALELKSQLDEAMRRLSLRDVELLEKSIVEGKALATIGQESPGINNGTSREIVRQHVERAKSHLRNALKRVQEEDESPDLLLTHNSQLRTR